MGTPRSTAGLFRCDACGNLGLGRGEMTCCDGVMEPVGREESAVRQPTLEELVRTVFGMSETELDVCLCVMEGGEHTASELAEQIDYDRSVVSRHLNHLADLGVLDKRRRLLEAGGQVYVYAPVDQEAVRHRLAGAFMTWVQEATSLVDSLSRQKVEAMVEASTEDPQWRVYRE